MKVRAGATLAIAALIALGVAACAPIATLKPYDPSDGVSTTVGNVKVLNALVLSQAGRNGNLLFSAYNPSNELIQLTVQYDSDGTKVTKTATLLPDVTSDFGYGATGQFFLPGITTKPGSLMDIYFQYGDKEGKQIPVPVLDGSLPQYDKYLPTATPTPTPTSTNPPVLPPPVTKGPTPAPTPTGN
ncbi:MAG: hypothetical protein M3N46_04965 [Actinomycetota bacterium]|nr:hypothetical protein [Actinomycetota bacterium]